MLKIGITGGIGSGKSTVSILFKQLGIPIFCSDIEAKILMTNDENLLLQIKNNFGEDIIDPNGKINTKKLGQKVFYHSDLLHKLNSIIHPAVRTYFKQWVRKQSFSPYIINESALIFEHDLYKELDAVIVVLAPEDVRIKRVMKRDRLSENDILQRIKNQITDQERKQKGNYFIINDDINPVIPQVLKINAQLIEVAKQKKPKMRF